MQGCPEKRVQERMLQLKMQWALAKSHTFASSQVEGGVAVGVLHIDVGTGCQQGLHHGIKAAARCVVQGCCAILRLQVF